MHVGIALSQNPVCILILARNEQNLRIELPHYSFEIGFSEIVYATNNNLE